MKNAKVLRAIVCEEEQFEDQHDNQQYIYLRKKMIKQFSDVFKENLNPEDCLDIEPVKIQLVPDHKSFTPYNSRVPTNTPCYLESTARKELQRILKSGALKEVHHATPWSSKAFFVRKPGSPDDDPSLRLVMYVNQIIDRVGYPMDGSFHLLRRLDPQGTCFAEVDLC